MCQRFAKWAAAAMMSTSLVFLGAPPAAGQVTITEFSVGLTAGSKPAYVVAGSDGALWFTESNACAIGRISTAGVVTEYSQGITPGNWVQGITAGPDGALWFVEGAGGIGRITTAGVITEYTNGIAHDSSMMGITAGPDGALWFAENRTNRIGRISTAGVVTEYSAGITEGGGPYNIAAGPDGALWFTESKGHRIGRITTSGHVTEFSDGITPGSAPLGIVAGPDGALWFTEYNYGSIGRITTDGEVTEYSTGIPGSRPHEIAVGPDGALWFADFGTDRIGRITTNGVVTEFSNGITPGSSPYGIVLGKDGALWFTEYGGNRIGRVAGPWPQSVRWIPAAIHKDVPTKKAWWRTDIAVLNRSTIATTLTIVVHPPAGALSKTLALAGRSQVIVTDVAGWLGVVADSGALEVRSKQDIFLSGRIYNRTDATHTYGQDFDGQLSSELLAAGQSAWLPHLTENTLYRTNIGITNTGTTKAKVTLTLYDSSGHAVWSNTRDYEPAELYQYQQPYRAVGGIAGGFAKVTVDLGTGIVAYASVVDQNTADPTTISMKR
jgi:virginiamycin B lyase